MQESIDQKLTKIRHLVDKMSQSQEAAIALSKQYYNTRKPMISHSSFLGIQVGAIIYLNEEESSYAVCILTEKNHLKFVVVAQKYSVVYTHSHDFKEVLRIMEGRLRELINNEILLPGKTIEIKPMTEHGFISEGFSIYTIEVYLLD